MNDSNRNELLFREHILNLLSDDEVASVSTAETAVSLEKGEEFVDLEQLGRGVQNARTSAPVMGRVLPRKAVRDQTWRRILLEVTALHNTAAPAARSLYL